VAHGVTSCAAHSEVIDSRRLKISTPLKSKPAIDQLRFP
jgi:hypothetical protein